MKEKEELYERMQVSNDHGDHNDELFEHPYNFDSDGFEL
jgi:hypothetical protein